MAAGWGETEVPMDVSSRRPARVLHRHLAERGLLSFLSLLRAFQLHLITANQGPLKIGVESGGGKAPRGRGASARPPSSKR